METKEQLVKSIKEWVKIDNEIRALQKEQTQRKNEKKRISKELMEVMRKNEIDCFDIKDGQIMYTKKNVKKPITKKNLLGILSNYCQGDITKATEINNYILDNREEVVKENIVRKISTKPTQTPE
jgi:seryl-tRNA synthetase